MSAGNCDLCGHHDSSLVDGACPYCRERYAPAPVSEPVQDGEPSAYISALTARVREILHEVLELPDTDTMEHILTEALFQHSRNARRDASANRHIGALGYAPDCSRPIDLKPTRTPKQIKWRTR